MDKYFIWLANTVNVSAKRMADLLKMNSPEGIFNDPDPVRYFSRLHPKTRDYLLAKDITQAENTVKRCEKEGIDTVTMESKSYPRQLLDCSSPPSVLYYKGRLPQWGKVPIISIVGCRKASIVGLTRAKTLAAELARAGFIVVSGMAAGIDGAAHKGALEAGGFTIAVLGTGVERCYPTHHGGLMRQIVKNGLVLSQFPPDDSGGPGNFPRRNHLVSALGSGVVVVEAQERSGSLITADIAVEQGRDLFVVPGSPGTDRLIARGGDVVTVRTAEDILAHYGLVEKTREQAKPLGLVGTDFEIYTFIKDGTRAEDIMYRLDLSPQDFKQRITLLEIRGHIVKVGHETYKVAER